MRFVCGKCNAKYSIADERVAGKVLKIRCKACNGIIEVSGAPAAPATTPRSPAPPAAPGRTPPAAPKPGKPRPAAGGRPQPGPALADRFAESFKPTAEGKVAGTPGLFQAVKRSAERLEKDETEAAAWFVAIDNKPMGPIAARVVRRQQKSGKVTDDSLVWKDGMPDWAPLRNCKELVGLLAKLAVVESLDGKEEPAGPGPDVPRAPRGGLFAGAAETEVEAPSPLRGQRMGRVDEVPSSLPGPAASLAPAVLDEVLADLAPAAPAKAVSAERDFFGGFPDAEGMDNRLSSLQQISPPRVAGRNRWITMAAVGFLGMAVAVLVMALFTESSDEVRVITEVVEKVVEVEKEKIVYRDQPQKPAGDDGAEEEGAERKGTGTRVGSGRGAAAGGTKTEAETMDEKKKKLLEQMGLGVPTGDQALVGGGSKTSGADKGSGSFALTDDQIRSTLANNRNSIQLCYERSLKQGEVPEDRNLRVDTRILVGGSGVVRSANVAGEAAQYPRLRSCIETAVKKWVFPASSGDSSVEIPTLFTPK